MTAEGRRFPHLDRRAFLALGVGAVAWACSRGGDDDPDATGGSSPGSTAAASAAGGFQVFAGARIIGVGDTRQPFYILKDNKPQKIKDLKVELSGPGIEPFEVEATHHEITKGLGGETIEHSDDHTHAPGTEVEDIYVIRHDFDREGVWDLKATFDGGSGTAPFQVMEETPWPGPGDDAIASKSATLDDPRGVDPICTREPICSMHDMTIAEALAEKKPLVISFATPKFCTSRACGPVVDLIQAEKERVGSEANFVHVEVWRNDGDAVGQDAAPAFTEWKFDGEPWTYFIGADGKVKERWLGPVGGDELTRAIDALLA